MKITFGGIIGGIVTGILLFIGAAYLINFITSGIQDNDLRIIVKIVVWFFSVGLILWISALLGSIVAAFISAVFSDYKTLRWKKRR